MGFYSRRILPKLIDKACSQPPMQALRGRYVSRASGRVLEIGIGSGLNLPHYGADVESITGLDPAAELTAMAKIRADDVDAPVDLLQVSGQEIPADDGSYDTLVCTWTLCSIPDVSSALKEMYRVVKP